MRQRLSAWLGFAAIMTVAGVLHHLGWASLVAWAPRPFSEAMVPWLIALLVVGHGLISLTPARHRMSAMLALSAIVWWRISPALVVGGAAWVLALRRVLWSGAPRALTLGFPIATLVALLIVCDAAHFPRLVAHHPWLWIAATTFALNGFLRTLVLWHQARTGLPRPSRRELLVYFGYAPFALVPPYMLALPRLGVVTDGIRAWDPAVMRSGLRWIGYGLGVEVTLVALGRLGLDPQPLLIDALRARDWPQAIPLALIVYPVRAVFEACGAGALVVGLCRTSGVALAPAFDAPLLARGVADWWRRYNIAFRGLLVDLFWMPVALRLRRRPILAGYLGCAVVFLCGSVPLHWPKQAALHGSPWTFPWSTAAESVVMTLLVGTALALERRRRRPAMAAPWRRWSQRALTWAMVCGAILGVGYQVDYRVRIAPWERLAERGASVMTATEAAALLPAARSAVAERPFATERRIFLARLLLTVDDPVGALDELYTAAAFAAHPALASARPLPHGRAPDSRATRTR